MVRIVKYYLPVPYYSPLVGNADLIRFVVTVVGKRIRWIPKNDVEFVRIAIQVDTTFLFSFVGI